MPIYFTGQTGPALPLNSIQYNSGPGQFAGDANLTWVPATGLTVKKQLFFGPGASVLDPFVQAYIGPSRVLVTDNETVETYSGGITVAAQSSVASSGLTGLSLVAMGPDSVYGGQFYGIVNGPGNGVGLYASGVVRGAVAVNEIWSILAGAPSTSGGATVVNAYGLQVEGVTIGSTNYSVHLGAGLYHFDALTASRPVFTDASKNLISAQGASVADATDNATAITQLNALISRLEGLNILATV